jgi:hypothetical protein
VRAVPLAARGALKIAYDIANQSRNLETRRWQGGVQDVAPEIQSLSLTFFRQFHDPFLMRFAAA